MIDVGQSKRYEREIRAMLRAAGDDDPEGFAQVVKLLDWAVSEGLREAASRLRESDTAGVPGYSWAEIASPLGVTRSAAQQRFGHRNV
jgi:hypothetical protein